MQKDLIAGIAPTVLPAPSSIQDYLSVMGLETPTKRATVASALVTAALYAARQPAFFFTERGTLKRFAIDPDEDDVESATQLHFAIVPILVFGFVYTFL